MNDTLGQPDPQPYGAAIWDGQSWEFKKIFHSTNIPVKPRGIQVISPDEIYLAAGSIFRWDGVLSTVQMVFSRLSLPDPNATIEKLWGISGSSIYGVGNVGSIVYYNGQSWQRIESGTDVDIQDIWGITGSDSDDYILCAASNAIAPGEHKILRILNNNSVDTIGWISNKRLHSVWMDSRFQLFACGDGVFMNNYSNSWEEQDELTFVFTERVRGAGKNDIFVVGHFGLLAHYNGVSWKEYPEASAALVYTSVNIKNDLIIIVGYTQSKAVIQMFTRNPRLSRSHRDRELMFCYI